MKKINVYGCFLLAAAAVLPLAACTKDPAKVITQRAEERWQLLISGQPSKAYDFLSPGYRTTHTLDQYVASISMARIKWKSAKVTKQSCESDVCTLEVMVASTLPASLARVPKDVEFEVPVVEQWVSADGQWYYRPDSAASVVKSADSAAPAGERAAPVSTAPPQPEPPSKP